ncbi:serine/threonine-protein kinase HAL4/sat4 [Gonapodya sp. JEL0774]|nr:serine/threonine-protein kinase HAL4/sat4 [Gonapodya sp. JEL0774]
MSFLAKAVSKVLSPSSTSPPSEKSSPLRPPPASFRASAAAPATTTVTAASTRDDNQIHQPLGNDSKATSPAHPGISSPVSPLESHDAVAHDHDHGRHTSQIVFGRIPYAPEPDGTPPGDHSGAAALAAAATSKDKSVFAFFAASSGAGRNTRETPRQPDTTTTQSVVPQSTTAPSRPSMSGSARGGAVRAAASSGNSPNTSTSSSLGLSEAEYQARLNYISWPTTQILRHKYTIVSNSQIGKGAEGTVKLVHPIDNPTQLFCVKTFHRKTSDLLAYVQRCVREHELTRQLEGHENVIKTVDLVMDDATWQVVEVLEYCRDGTLDKIMRRGKIREQGEGIAHNDWKVENITWEPDHKLIKVIDFGLSFRFAESTTAPAPDSTAPTLKAESTPARMRTSLVGSKMYMAPEQWSGNPWDPRAVDIWMVAIVYIYLSTRGKFPWPAAAQSEPSYAKWSKKGEFDKEIASRIPASSLPLLRRMLSTDPARRPSATTLLDDPWLKLVPVCARRAAREAGYKVETDGYMGMFQGGTPPSFGMAAGGMVGARREKGVETNGRGKLMFFDESNGSPEDEEDGVEARASPSVPIRTESPSEFPSTSGAGNSFDGSDIGSAGLLNPNTGERPRRVPTVIMFKHEHRYS